MASNYKFTEEADSDLEEIHDYYEDIQEDLGKRFVKNVFEKVERIAKKPDSYSADEDSIRKAKISDFKYYIYYIIKSPIVLIIAVWHIARMPFDRKKRLQNID